MSHPHSVSSGEVFTRTVRSGWRLPGFVLLSVMLHLALIVVFLRNHTPSELLMSGAEGGVVAITMVNVVSQMQPRASVEKPISEQAPQEESSAAVAAPLINRPDAAIVLPAAPPGKRDNKVPLTRTEPRHEKKIKKVVRQEATPQSIRPARTSDTKPAALVGKIVSDNSGEPARQLVSAAVTQGPSAARIGSSDSGAAKEGAGSSNNQNLKALHRRVNYPQRAKAMGVEGRVKIKFDISASGTITNVRVLSETPVGVFAAAITKDISRWRYQTQGEVKDQTVLIIFKLNGQIALEN